MSRDEAGESERRLWIGLTTGSERITVQEKIIPSHRGGEPGRGRRTGRALQARGHAVRLYASGVFAPLAAKASVPAEAVALTQGEKPVPLILVRIETSPEDIQGMHAAKAIVTARGGMTSHAAVVARGMGRPCVCGADRKSVV